MLLRWRRRVAGDRYALTHSQAKPTCEPIA
jgi:hypothetical protein